MENIKISGNAELFQLISRFEIVSQKTTIVTSALDTGRDVVLKSTIIELHKDNTTKTTESMVLIPNSQIETNLQGEKTIRYIK